MDTEIKFVEDYWRTDYPAMDKREGLIQSEIGKTVSRVHFLSSLFPTTFYLSTANEVSSRGYLNFLDFYGFARERKKAFLRFYIDRTYYHDPRKLVNFVQGDEDIFQGRCRLPRYFLPGVIINLLYSIVLLFFAGRRSQRLLFPETLDTASLEGLDIDAPGNKITNIQVKQDKLSLHLLKILLGKSKKINWKFTLAGKAVKPGLSEEILYLPNLRHIPAELKPMDLLNFFKRLEILTEQGSRALVREYGREKLERCFSRLENEFKTDFLVKLGIHSQRPILLFWYFIHGNGISIEQRDKLSGLLESALTQEKTVINIVDVDSDWLSPHHLYIIKEIGGKFKIFQTAKRGQ